jgi:uncharacterized membrane protein YphA (DoxX/SURF4 family)
MGPAPGDRIVVGISPWLPWPLGACRWWTEPVRAERLAALRIGLAAVLLVDLFTTYLPGLHVFFGQGSLGQPSFFEHWFKGPRWQWSLLHGVEDPLAIRVAMVFWVVATVFMLLGFWTRLSVVLVWVLSVSFENVNPYSDNAGDQVRNIALFYLMLCPCGAAWSLDNLWARWLGRHDSWLSRFLGRPPGPVYVSPWALRLLLIQMAYIYCFNGIYKAFGEEWRRGNSLYYVLNDLTLARWSYAQFPIPVPLTRLLTKTVMFWEITFPLWLLLPWVVAGLWRIRSLRSRFTAALIRFLRRLRVLILLFGVAFHLGIFLMLEIGGFGPYMICLYLPIVPWERWIGRRKK